MQTLRPLPFAASLGLALSALSLLCWLAIWITPALDLAHSWIGLFTTSPANSVQALIAAVSVSFAAGAFTGGVTAALYERLTRGRT